MITQDFFAVFALPRTLEIDLPLLESRYLALQKKWHPDHFTNASAHEARVALQYATHLNEAWQTLKSLKTRARYFLELIGCDTAKNAVPFDFLEAHIALQERFGCAREEEDETALEALSQEVKRLIQEGERTLLQHFSEKLPEQYSDLMADVQILFYLEKLASDIDEAI